MTTEEGAAVVITECPKNKNETVRVSATECQGNELLGILTPPDGVESDASILPLVAP